MWGVPARIMRAGSHQTAVEAIARQFADRAGFLERVHAIYATSPPESYDLLELADGSVFERFSRSQFVDERNVGRVWSFRDITEQRRAQEVLRQQSEWLRITLSSIGDAVDHHGRGGRRDVPQSVSPRR